MRRQEIGIHNPRQRVNEKGRKDIYERDITGISVIVVLSYVERQKEKKRKTIEYLLHQSYEERGRIGKRHRILKRNCSVWELYQGWQRLCKQVPKTVVAGGKRKITTEDSAGVSSRWQRRRIGW